MGCHNVALQSGPGKTVSGGGVSTARLLFGMPFLDTRRQRAALLIFVLGLGLTYALWPFSSGLMGALVLYVVFGPAYHALVRRGLKPGLAAGVVVLVALVLVVGPGISFIGLIANEAQGMAAGASAGPI
jgi:predicted PurR-regulated permease PerM